MRVDDLLTPALIVDARAFEHNPATMAGVRLVPAHVDPTMAMHGTAWLVDGGDVLERWSVDLRGWN